MVSERSRRIKEVIIYRFSKLMQEIQGCATATAVMCIASNLKGKKLKIMQQKKQVF